MSMAPRRDEADDVLDLEALGVTDDELQAVLTDMRRKSSLIISDRHKYSPEDSCQRVAQSHQG